MHFNNLTEGIDLQKSVDLKNQSQINQCDSEIKNNDCVSSKPKVKPLLNKFKDEYQPFNIGYDDLDKIPMADIYKREGRRLF